MESNILNENQLASVAGGTAPDGGNTAHEYLDFARENIIKYQSELHLAGKRDTIIGFLD